MGSGQLRVSQVDIVAERYELELVRGLLRNVLNLSGIKKFGKPEETKDGLRIKVDFVTTEEAEKLESFIMCGLTVAGAEVRCVLLGVL